MIEELAKAAMGVEFKLPGAGGLKGSLRLAPAQAQDIVRAILERLREPTPEMLEAGAGQLFGSANDDWKIDAKLVFEAMLSAIDEKEVG